MPLTISFHRDLCVTLGPNLFMSMTINNLLLCFNYVLCVKETIAFLFFFNSIGLSQLTTHYRTHNSISLDILRLQSYRYNK